MFTKLECGIIILDFCVRRWGCADVKGALKTPSHKYVLYCFLEIRPPVGRGGGSRPSLLRLPPYCMGYSRPLVSFEYYIQMPNLHSGKFDYINLLRRCFKMIIQGIQLKITDAEKRFVSWLITQTNAQGKLYKPYVANRYAACLRSEPLKLDIPFSVEERNVYRCCSIQDFDRLEEIFRGAHNFLEIDRGQGHGTLSAGLSAYRRYVCYLEFSASGEISGEKQSNDVLLEALKKNYSGGFRFETTYINLLADASGVCIDEPLKAELKRHMFKRKDDVFFLIDQVSDSTTRDELLTVSTTYLHEYGCFEISELYRQFENRLNCICIRNAEDFEFFYQQIAQGGVRCVAAPQIGNRIARYSNGNVQTAFEMVVKKIISFITENCYGSCTEDDLHNEFQAFSVDLLNKLSRIFAEGDLIRVEINDNICFQSFEALGLPQNFADILIKTLDRLEEVGLAPSQEVLHTAISLELGKNFKTELSLPEWNTFRRLIASYYKGETCREWRNNVFGEVER